MPLGALAVAHAGQDGAIAVVGLRGLGTPFEGVVAGPFRHARDPQTPAYRVECVGVRPPAGRVPFARAGLAVYDEPDATEDDPGDGVHTVSNFAGKPIP